MRSETMRSETMRSGGRLDYKTTRDRIGAAEYARRVEAAKQRLAEWAVEAAAVAAERAHLAEMRRLDRLVADQHNEDHPDGCERCGEKYGPGDNGPAEIVLADGRHIVVHAVCIDGEELA